jgi:hypothetical protein
VINSRRRMDHPGPEPSTAYHYVRTAAPFASQQNCASMSQMKEAAN